eukprot:2454173-Pyramimonas_sp.AAC.1
MPSRPTSFSLTPPVYLPSGLAKIANPTADCLLRDLLLTPDSANDPKATGAPNPPTRPGDDRFGTEGFKSGLYSA